jgi:hypothetical protein
MFHAHCSSVIGRNVFKCIHSSSASSAVLQFLASQVSGCTIFYCVTQHVFYCMLRTTFHNSVIQAIFKEARETLLRIGAMRFVDSLVTERPMPPARTLHASNETHSLAFRFGTEDSVSLSPEDRASCIVPMLSLHVDSRALDGQLSVFQSTPAGTCTVLLLYYSANRPITLLKAMPLAKLSCSSCFLIPKPSLVPPQAHSAYDFALQSVTTITTCPFAAVLTLR